MFGGVGCDELLRQMIIAAGSTKTQALKNQPIVASQHRRRTLGAQRAEARQAGLFERAFGFLRATAQGDSKPGTSRSDNRYPPSGDPSRRLRMTRG